MAEMILTSLVWTTFIGLALFVMLYAVLTPWKDPMGRHIFFFMLALLVAFIYGVINQNLSFNARIEGWIVVIAAIAGVVWWRVVILVVYMYKNKNIILSRIQHYLSKVKR
jgi:hypothetical protein